jgi:hypothetical protein
MRFAGRGRGFTDRGRAACEHVERELVVTNAINGIVFHVLVQAPEHDVPCHSSPIPGVGNLLIRQTDWHSMSSGLAILAVTNNKLQLEQWLIGQNSGKQPIRIPSDSQRQ